MNYFVSPTKTASVSQQINGLYAGKVSRVVDGEVFVEVPSIINGFSFGPAIISNYSSAPSVNDVVICGFLNNSLDELVILGLSGVVTIDHGSLDGLSDDDHPQYTSALEDLESRILVNTATRAQLGSDFTGSSGDLLGTGLSFSDDGSRVAMGAQGGSSSAGEVSIYDWDGSTWSQVGADIVGGTSGMNLGSSVSLSADGSRVAVGAFAEGGLRGQVEVYEYSGGSWTQLGANLNGDAAGDYFGKRVALSSDGSRLLVGAPYNDDFATYAGMARVFDWNGSSWSQVGSDLLGAAANDTFGEGVAISADGAYIAIGAKATSGNGYTKVFHWDGSSWVQLGETLYGENSGDYSGFAVDLSASGSRVAIGAYLNDEAASNAGHIRVLDWNGSSWVQVGEDIDGLVGTDTIGFSVGISSDGTRIVAGGFYSGSGAGVGRYYVLTNVGWRQVTGDMSGVSSSQYGYAAAISGDGKTFGLGGPYANTNAGLVEVYKVTTDVDPF